MKNGKRKLNIMYADFCYYNKHTLHSRFIPLSIGMIAQYSKQKFGEDINVSLFKNIEKFFEKAKENPPDVVGLSVYFWNKAINKYAVNRLRQMFGKKVIIVVGGPSIDSDIKEQYNFLTSDFPNIDAVITNEGELGFYNLISNIIGDPENLFKNPIDGLSFLKGNAVVTGLPVGLTLDLSTMGSPYLSGLMDEFMNSDYQPLVQTSRFCPYTCAFCVSGKNRGKLRGYPIEQIEEELKYVSKKYVDRPHHTMYLVDENFGILKRDVEIAKLLRKCKEDIGFPQSVFFYNDKRFTGTSREVLEILKDMTQYGVTLALQTENPEALKAINRRNVTEKEIDSAIKWAKGLGLETSTELIFGMPFDTKETFVNLLNRSVDRGFDNVLIHNLLLMDGIEMNRKAFREKYNYKTKFRSNATHYGMHEGTFFSEHEETPISSHSFSNKDFWDIRGLNFMFYATFNLKFQKWFFQFIRHLGIPLSEFFSNLMEPDLKNEWPEEYLNFLSDFKTTVEGELFDTREEMVAKTKEVYMKNKNNVGEPTRINTNFGARLSYLEGKWVKSVLLQHLDLIKGKTLSSEDRKLAASLIDLANRERIDLMKSEEKKPLRFSVDIINWKENKFKESIKNLKMPEKSVKFIVGKSQATMISSFQKRFNTYEANDFYNAAMDFVQPRKYLLHSLSYDE
jgi:radical SAM superfamily enzyme YgiQ (UPF0313 family)